jgi:hypothetical protein
VPDGRKASRVPNAVASRSSWPSSETSPKLRAVRRSLSRCLRVRGRPGIHTSGSPVREPEERVARRPHSRVSAANRRYDYDSAKSVLVTAFLGNAFRSRARRFESCWGRQPGHLLKATLTSHSAVLGAWLALPPSAAAGGHPPASSPAGSPHRRCLRTQLAGQAARPAAGRSRWHRPEAPLPDRDHAWNCRPALGGGRNSR